jgi:hypothetical protein
VREFDKKVREFDKELREFTRKMAPNNNNNRRATPACRELLALV